jgi:hypothetical protein
VFLHNKRRGLKQMSTGVFKAYAKNDIYDPNLGEEECDNKQAKKL